MLSEALRKQLNQLVFDFLGVHPAVATIECLLGDGRVQHLPMVDRPFQIAVWVVDSILHEMSEHRFCNLIEQVDAGGTVPALQTLADALRAGRITWGHHYNDPLVVLDDEPFVDRESVRGLIAGMFSNTVELGCLLVLGDAGEGKSYLLPWCAKVARRVSTGKLASFQVDGSMAASLLPGIVATKLATDLGLNVRLRPRQHEDHERWAEDLGHWIIHHILKARVVSVIVLDGLHHPQIPLPVHTLIRALVRARQSDPEVNSLLRIVLLGYDGGLLDRHQLNYEIRKLEFVDRAMVRDWLERRYPGRKGYEYDVAATLICEAIPSSGPARMRALCTEIRAIGPELEGP